MMLMNTLFTHYTNSYINLYGYFAWDSILETFDIKSSIGKEHFRVQKSYKTKDRGKIQTL